MSLDLKSIYQDLGELDGVIANLTALSKSCGPVNPIALAPIVARMEALLQTIDAALPPREADAG